MAKSKTLRIIALTALMIALAAIGQLLIDIRTFSLEYSTFLLVSSDIVNFIIRIILAILLFVLIFFSYKAIRMITAVGNEK